MDPSLFQGVKGSSLVLSGSLSSYVWKLVIGLLMARLMGAHDYGIYSLFLATIALLGGVSLFGLPQALTRFVPLLRKQGRDVSGMLRVSVIGPVLVGAFVGLGFYALAPILDAERIGGKDLSVPLLLAAIAVPFSALHQTSCFAALAFHRLRYRVLAEDVLRPALKLILVALVGFFGLTAARAVAIEVLCIILGCLVLLALLKPTLSRYWHRPPQHEPLPIGEVFRFSVPVYLHRFTLNLSQNLPVILLGTFSSAASVGIYTIASRILSASRTMHSAITNASLPIISELSDYEDLDRLGRYYTSLSQWSLMLYLPVFAACLFLPDKILSLFGKPFAEGAEALMLLAAGQLVNVGTGICGAVLTMTGRSGVMFLNSLFRLALTGSLCWLLIPSLGLTGGAWAVSVTNALANLLIAIEVYRFYGFRPLDQRAFRLILGGAVAFSFAALLAWLLNVHWYGSLVAYTVGTLLYAAILWKWGVSQEERLLLERIRAGVRRRLAHLNPRC